MDEKRVSQRVEAEAQVCRTATDDDSSNCLSFTLNPRNPLSHHHFPAFADQMTFVLHFLRSKTLHLTASAVVALLLCSCASSTKVSSERSLDFPPARVAKGGSVCVVTLYKVRRVYPTELEKRGTQLAEDAFRAKGFTISENMRGADYGFVYFPSMRTYSNTGATLIGNSVIMSDTHVMNLMGEFREMTPAGDPGKVLWKGFASAIGSPRHMEEKQVELLEPLLEQFPN